jgi:molybdate transport system regulatory protein
MSRRSTQITGDIRLSSDQGGDITAKRIELLQAIDTQGSISSAARQQGISYRSAWDAVDQMNNLWERPLVVKQPGGVHGGATRLTDEGRALIDGFRLLQAEYRRFTQGLNRKFDKFELLEQSVRRLSMRSSARNQFQGRVEKLTTGPVNTQVTLAINEQERITSIISSESVHQLGLSLGCEAYALIKASFIILASADGDCVTSSRNRLCGRLRELRHGPVSSEAIIELQGGKTLTAIITDESAKAMGLDIGSPVCALIKASHVILGVN